MKGSEMELMLDNPPTRRSALRTGVYRDGISRCQSAQCVFHRGVPLGYVVERKVFVYSDSTRGGRAMYTPSRASFSRSPEFFTERGDNSN